MNASAIRGMAHFGMNSVYGTEKTEVLGNYFLQCKYFQGFLVIEPNPESFPEHISTIVLRKACREHHQDNRMQEQIN